MKIAITGATGFIGNALVQQLLSSGHELRIWHRANSNLAPFQNHLSQIDFVEGELANGREDVFIQGCDAVVHAGLWREARSFQLPPSSVTEYARVNILGSLALMESAVKLDVSRFVFVSTCAVHDVILTDRPLDESHPLWAKTHYGAHKAAVEQFVHSFGLGQGFPICALRPTGVYGVMPNPQNSKWFELIQSIKQGRATTVSKGGKEVHVDDVAKAIGILLAANEIDIAGESFACYDRYISEFDVASCAKRLSGSDAEIVGEQRRPQNEIVTGKIEKLGMIFGGEAILERTVESLVTMIE